jgi:lipopolysaccharide/colanic/teichoic acid biosynthesis glycosyltransferase
MFPNKKTRSKQNRLDPSSPISYLLDPEYGLYIEGYFIERLCFERQRTERSKKPILMMLLDLTNVATGEKDFVIGAIDAVLSDSTRETDLKGWYKHDTAIGVLFTEICDIDVDALKQKICGALYERLNADQANSIDVSFHIFPESQDQQQPNGSTHQVFYPDRASRDTSKRSYFMMKRAIDIVGSACCVMVFSPIFLVVTLMIKLTSNGPVIYRQERVGLHGKRFTMLKFRSMYVNNDPSIHKQYVSDLITRKNGNGSGGGTAHKDGVYKLTHDTRVTMIGRFLRRSSLDEFPQFLNVLKGEMSLIGPRPPIPYELEKYDTWHRRRILDVRPGISGLWQVTGRSSMTFDEMVRLDLKYTKEQSIWLDIKILLRTPWAVFTAKGAH